MEFLSMDLPRVRSRVKSGSQGSSSQLEVGLAPLGSTIVPHLAAARRAPWSRRARVRTDEHGIVAWRAAGLGHPRRRAKETRGGAFGRRRCILLLRLPHLQRDRPPQEGRRRRRCAVRLTICAVCNATAWWKRRRLRRCWRRPRARLRRWRAD